MFCSKALLIRVAEVIATEVRAHWNDNRAHGVYKVFYGLSCFSPEMNLMRHPLWGRNQVILVLKMNFVFILFISICLKGPFHLC